MFLFGNRVRGIGWYRWVHVGCVLAWRFGLEVGMGTFWGWVVLGVSGGLPLAQENRKLAAGMENLISEGTGDESLGVTQLVYLHFEEC